MRIAQVAPLIESVPPKYYGGTERVVSYLTEELVKQGHDVTLFASGDSITNARLEAITDEALRLKTGNTEPMAQHFIMLNRINKMAHMFDIIHFHIDMLHFAQHQYMLTPSVTTMHGRLDLQHLPVVFDEFSEVPVISISNSQRIPIPKANWQATVYNGVPMENYTFNSQPGDYLAFVGRISPEKGVERAIHIAMNVGMKLYIAAKIDKVDQEYYQNKIKPMLDHPLVEYIGEIDEREKNTFLGGAYATLFPIDWPEPFGLVMIESMACGTPVIAFNRGSVAEVMLHGETGFIVNSLDEAIDAVEKVETISRQCCRYIFEKRFSSKQMAVNYLQSYKSMISENEYQQPIAI